MFKCLIRSILIGALLPLTMLTTFNAYAETMHFSYTFEGSLIPEGHPWGLGATLTGQIDGSIDPLDPDRVFINSFGQVVLSRPTLDVFEYDDIDASEFTADSSPGATPATMSFSGTILDFQSCPEGFTNDLDGDGVLDDCPFGLAPGGGFVMNAERGLATAADGTGAEVCPDERRLHGCRVADRPFLPPENWGLVVLPDNADIHPSAVIGSASEIGSNAQFKQDVMVGDNVSIGDESILEHDVTLGDDVDVGFKVKFEEYVVIGNAVSVGENSVIKKCAIINDNASIGAFVTIEEGAVIGAGVMIGDFALVPPGPAVCPSP